MKTFDVINSIFQLGGAMAAWINVRKILKDKHVKGVYWPLTLYYAGWGLWNLAFFSHLEQLWSLASGTLLVSGNLAWSAIALEHNWLQKRRLRQTYHAYPVD